MGIPEKVKVIKERSTEKDGVTAELKNRGQGESYIEPAVRLSGGDRAPEINYGRKIKRKIEGVGSVSQPAVVEECRQQKESCGNQISRTREKTPWLNDKT
jgi:hypothetical protein